MNEIDCNKLSKDQKVMLMLKAKSVYDEANATQGIVLIEDADSILADIVENADAHIPQIFEEIYGIWMNAKDKDSVEAMFYSLTGVEFFEYVDRTIKETNVHVQT